MNEIKYYAVDAKCGHVGKKNYIRITFGVKANSKKEAAQKGRVIPRVKHEKKDAILNVKEISCEDYLNIIKQNKTNPYLKSHSKQDQKKYCIDLDTHIEKEKEIEVKRNRVERLMYKRKKYLSLLSCDRYLKEINY